MVWRYTTGVSPPQESEALNLDSLRFPSPKVSERACDLCWLLVFLGTSVLRLLEQPHLIMESFFFEGCFFSFFVTVW